MKSVAFIFAFVALFGVVLLRKGCPEQSCYQWPGCKISFNNTRCRCEAVCDLSDSRCESTPCGSDNFCFGYRRAGPEFNCACTRKCMEPPFCSIGYKDCVAWNNCKCMDESDLLYWSSSIEDDRNHLKNYEDY